MSLYPIELHKFLDLNKNYIPRLMGKENIKVGKRYYDISANENFRVIDTYNVEDVPYFTIKSGGKYHAMTSPSNHKIYQLFYNKKHLSDVDIINNNRYYYGYEIAYWFYLNKRYLDHKYSKFISYIEYSSKSCINMNKKYKVKAFHSEEQDIYYGIRFISCSNK